MLMLRKYVLGVLLVVGQAVAQVAGPTPVAPAQVAGYAYVWGDDWTHYDVTQGHDPGHNWYDTGVYFVNPCGTKNQIDPVLGGYSATLTQGQVDAYTQPCTDVHISSYNTSATDSALTGHAWQYGYFEAKIKFTPVTGAWPSFYLEAANAYDLINSPFGKYPEIDVFEWQSNDPLKLFESLHVWQSDANGMHGAFIASQQFQPPLTTDFSQYHTYGLLWTPTGISYYLDNVLMNSTTNNGIQDTRAYPYSAIYTGFPAVPLAIHLTVGAGCNFGNYTFPQTTCPGQANVVSQQVAWVHVFQRPTLAPASTIQ